MSGYTYYDFAEDDYSTVKRLVRDMQNNGEGPTNTMCSIAQKGIEKYLKYVIEEEVNDSSLTPSELTDKNRLMHTHTLKDLINFVQKHAPHFNMDVGPLKLADGYYFDTNHPGQNAFFVSDNNVTDCLDALERMKASVDAYFGY